MNSSMKWLWNDVRERAAIFDHTVRGALSPPHTSRAPGFATKDQASARDSNAAQRNTQDMEATLANLLRKECQGCSETRRPSRPASRIQSSGTIVTSQPWIQLMKWLWNDYETTMNSCMNFVDALYEMHCDSGRSRRRAWGPGQSSRWQPQDPTLSRSLTLLPRMTPSASRVGWSTGIRVFPGPVPNPSWKQRQ
jgi:hypothetical protein